MSRPVVFGDFPTLGCSFIALDLEYGPEPLIWLIGVCLVGPSSARYLALWADTAEEEERNLRRLTEIIAENAVLPVVTWNGNGADMPQLRNAAKRLKLGQALDVM